MNYSVSAELEENIILVGNSPRGVAVDESRNIVYVVNEYDQSLSIINGDTLEVNTIPLVGGGPRGVVVNEDTNTVYVASYGAASVLRINGDTLETNLVSVGSGPWGIAVDESRNIVYVANTNDDTLSIINGDTLEVNTIGVGDAPGGVAVNEDTNTVYVTNFSDYTLSIINGDTLEVNTIAAGYYPWGVAVNEDTNTVYVTNRNDDKLKIIDGDTLETLTIRVGDHPLDVIVDESRNIVYVANRAGDTLSIINSDTFVVNTIAVGDAPWGIAVDESRNIVYVANTNDDTLSIIHETNIPENPQIEVENDSTSITVRTHQEKFNEYYPEWINIKPYPNDGKSEDHSDLWIRVTDFPDYEHTFTDLPFEDVCVHVTAHWDPEIHDNITKGWLSSEMICIDKIIPSPIPKPPTIEIKKIGSDSADVIITQEQFGGELPNQFRIKVYDPKNEPNPPIDHQNDVLGYNTKGPITGLGPGKECFYVTASWNATLYDNESKGWLNSETQCLDFEGIDKEPPKIKMPNPIKKFVDNKLVGLEVVFDPIVSDNVDSHSSLHVSCDPSSGSFFNIGSHEVTCTVTDKAGLTTSYTTMVIVESKPVDMNLDSDGDGIADNLDLCKNQPEIFNGYLDSDGCPDEDITTKIDEIQKTVDDPEITNLLNNLETVNDEQLERIEQQQESITKLQVTNDEQLERIEQQQESITKLQVTNDEQNDKLTESLNREIEQSIELDKIRIENGELKEDQAYSTLVTIIISVILTAAGIIAGIGLHLRATKKQRHTEMKHDEEIKHMEQKYREKIADDDNDNLK